VTAKISLRDVVVRRSDAEILRVNSLDLLDGEVLAVLGPNGAGKSTLMSVLGLLEQPAEGEVLFEGASAFGRELELRRRMAAVFQESLLLNRSVESNVALGLSLRGVARAERRDRVRHWLARFGVDALAKRSARSLSGGEAQRVSLARAFALEPEVILLDEPFSALDQPTRESLVEELASVLQETPLTTVFVTHDRDEAARLADRVAVLAGGRVLQVGPTTEVFSMPADETVAAYVGVENIVLGYVMDITDGLVLLEVGRAQLEVAADGFDAPAALVCLRPEDITLSVSGRDAPSSARNHLQGNVARIVAAGGEMRVELDCGFRLVASVTRRSLEELGLAIGSPVVASFKATAVHLIPRGQERPAA
jgi:tungstate transport system ATP-binding protein